MILKKFIMIHQQNIVKKLENDTEGLKDNEVNEIVNEENLTEDPPKTGGDTGAPDKGR